MTQPDIESLNKALIFPAKPDTPGLVYAAVEVANPSSMAPLDRYSLEPYLRLKALPQDIMRLVMCVVEGQDLSDKISALVPGLGRAQPTHYPSGVVELQWKLDDGSIFGLVLSGFASKLKESNGQLSVERCGRIKWRFHGPRNNPQHGEFENVEELLEFVSKSFVTSG